MYWTLRHVFQEKQSMRMISGSVATERQLFEDTSVLGGFLDNHGEATKFPAGLLYPSPFPSP